MTDKNTIKELEDQARNTKLLMDRLNLAYIGLTTDEILRLMFLQIQSDETRSNLPQDDA